MGGPTLKWGLDPDFPDSLLWKVTPMGKEKNQILDRINKGSLGEEFTHPLDQIKSEPGLYRHRKDGDLDSKKDVMRALMDSLLVEGQLEAVIVRRDSHDNIVNVTGHRRLAAMRALSEENAPGFAPDTPVRVREILNATPQDCLVWSVADNVLREGIDEEHKLEAAILLLDKGVDHTRIRKALKLTESTFARYLNLAESRWMLGHVNRSEIGLTDAYRLLELAKGNGGAAALKNLQEDLARLVRNAKAKIQEKREELAERHKDLKGSEAMVKSYFPAYLVKKWVLDLKHGKQISPRAKFIYAAAIESDKNGKRVVIPGLSLPLVPSNWDKFAAVVKTLNKFTKDLTFETNLLARQQLALQAWQDDDDGPTDWRSVAWTLWPSCMTA